MSKDWYYAVEGVSNGPVSPPEFERLVATGTIRSDTLVWQEGMEDWLPYSRAQGDSDLDVQPPHAPSSYTTDPARADANTFLGALKDGFARYVDFKTRSTRSQFWYWTVWSLIFGFASSMVDVTLGMADAGPVNALVSLATFLPSIAVAIRRLHDTGRRGWWLLLALVPVIGWIILIVFYCIKSEDSPNAWGPEPRH